MNPSEWEAVDRLDAYLDAVALGHATTGDGVDPDLWAVAARLRRLGPGPEPSPVFAARLWSGLMPAAPDAAAPPLNLDGRAHRLGAESAPAAPVGNGRRQVSLAHLATAAVLLLSLALNALAFGVIPFRGAIGPARLPAVWAPGEVNPVAFAWLTRGALKRKPLTDPYHLAIDPNGNLWVTDPWLSQFEIYAPDGAFREVWGAQGNGAGAFNFFNVGSSHRAGGGAAAFDRAGTLYVLDPGNFRVQKFAPDRRFVSAWGDEGREDGQFLDLVDVAVDARGRVYVLDAGRADIQVFDADGRFLASWGSVGSEQGGLRAPSGMAIDAAGNIVVADTGNRRLQTFSPDGQPLASWSGAGTDPQTSLIPADVAADGAGRVYVTDAANDRVVILGSDGQPLAAWGEAGSAPGEFAGPTGIALDAAGNAYVADRGNNRVQAFRLLPPFGE